MNKMVEYVRMVMYGFYGGEFDNNYDNTCDCDTGCNIYTDDAVMMGTYLKLR
jgi:hypothetical protein